MSTCTMLACLMFFFQNTNEQADVRAQLRPRVDSADVTWAREPRNPPPVRIRGPYWSRGFALHRTTERRVWLTPGPPGPVLGRTFGAIVSVDF
jgi:hypothetical protein